jgi:hypothetical protein
MSGKVDINEFTRQLIRGKLTHFLNSRERAYQFIAKKGAVVPGYDVKMKAITSIRIQLSASRTWDLNSHLKWIHSMRDQIMALLPYEFHDDPKQRKYRKHMTDLLKYCEDLLDSKQLSINPKLHFYGNRSEKIREGETQRFA